MEEKLKKISKMIEKAIEILIKEIYSKPPKKNYAVEKTDFYHIDIIWSLEILHLKYYGHQKQ